MRRILKQLRKGIRAACVTAAVATCWNVGEPVAHANPGWGDQVTIQVSGTVKPAEKDLSHVFLIFCTGASSWQSDYQAVHLGDFDAGQSGAFSIQANAKYDPVSYWIIAGLYGDISGGQYVEGTNGVTLNAMYDSGDVWSDDWADFFKRIYQPDIGDAVLSRSQSDMFTYLLNGDIAKLTEEVYWDYKYMTNSSDLEFTMTAALYNFSVPTQNGTVEITSTVIPEPTTVLLLGAGGVVALVLKRRRN